MATKQRPRGRAEQGARPRDARSRGAKPTFHRGLGPDAKRTRRRERLGKGVKIVLVAIGVFAMVLSVSTMACAGILNQGGSTTDYHLTGGVAATVNGINIKEDSVTDQIMNSKKSYDTDEKWAQHLVDSDQTPQSLRESTINSLARQYLISEAEQKNNISVTDDEVNQDWKDKAASFGSEDEFRKQITNAGMTEASYKSSLKSSLMQQKLKDVVAPATDPGDQEIIDYVNKDISTYNDARRSSNILFKVDSGADEDADAEVKAKAQDVLDKINAGELSFEDAVDTYSEDTTSKKDKGDVGWDKLTTFVTDYSNALSQLSKGQMSGLVKSTYGYHIILCTDYFHVDDTVTSIDQIPGNLKDKLSDTIKKSNASTAYTTWQDDLVKGADIQIHDMPSDLPYDVSLDGVQKSNGSAS